jgi:hypothetical protein
LPDHVSFDLKIPALNKSATLAASGARGAIAHAGYFGSRRRVRDLAAAEHQNNLGVAR